MTGLLHHFAITLKLNLRNRMAMVYGYAVPVFFLAMFIVLHRYDRPLLVPWFGQLLTVTILGGACFGLPTSIVVDRERGVWRRYRLTPVSPMGLMISTVAARYLIVLSAGILQLLIALSIGMPMPAHLLGLLAAFSLVCIAFMGMGLVIAMLADTALAVQALGICIFLPMIALGGVMVPLATLPRWVQHLSAFLPARYAVEALQPCVNGAGLRGTPFALLSLTLIGFAGFVAGAGMFRWDVHQPGGLHRRMGWLVPALAAWLAVGVIAESRHRVGFAADAADLVPRVTTTSPDDKHVAIGTHPAMPSHASSWEALTPADIDAIDYRGLPGDNEVVSPFATPDEKPEEPLQPALDTIQSRLPDWPPGNIEDLPQRIRNLLSVAAVADIQEDPLERYIPVVVFDRLKEDISRPKLIKALAWVAMNPDEGTVINDVSEAGFAGGAAGNSEQIRERINYYSLKMLGRLTGRLKDEPAK